MILALLLTPSLAGLLAFWIRGHRWRRALLVATALAQVGMTAQCWQDRPEPIGGGWLALDSMGLLFLSITSVLFLAAAIYGAGYLAREEHNHHADFSEGFLFVNEPEAVFTGCLLLFLAAMTLVTVSQHFGLLWIGVEATTLASAPLIYYHRHHRSLEATWKYLLVCSVGIALALLGNFALAAATSGGETASLTLSELTHRATSLHAPTLKMAFLFFVVGYGTKMGLAPLHTWLPDAHSEAPSLVSALFSGALLNCAFLALLRVFQVCHAAGEAAFARQIFVGFGLLSMAVAGVFILRQADFKRMLAYSSVEHMGILALGVGLGGAGVFGAMLHTLNHSLTKACLFLIAGNILAAYRTRTVDDINGMSRMLPCSGILWLAGFLAITGSPPFGPFLSEFTIFKAALEQGRPGVAVAYLALLALVFIGMGAVVLHMTQGEREPPVTRHEPLWSIVPPALLAGCVLVLGLYVPPALQALITDIARTMGGL